ncbi:dihydroxyacetone kinase family protein [Pararobbsia silviterrae]|uniref:Dihydroxyacetone kinase subunit DhaK n=1 Tax=Pararobbsia silviterrae TaxID=1792498 RepID=A0A494XML1_9BURK|nr:dihydroxyacetone kinase family protein [Pararobbsia silviterrae]RKP51927.1 dihydroxyacetone kinase subunit DhaK [Pararobbsia silviterrae]
MKKLLNDPASVVPDMLDGLVALNPELTWLPHSGVVIRADAQSAAAQGEVALISGGGSGHEPAHAGYVGPGMLSAAVAGEVFTSPSTDAVLDAIRAVAGAAGVLLIVKNYTGDRFNFGLAAEIARSEGIPVEMVIVADDVALSASGEHAGRRGLAGTVLVHKIAGAAAAERRPLKEVAQIAREAAAALGTMGVALTPCTVPAAGRPGFTLGDDEIEWGLGIHGEPGVRRGALEPAGAIVETLLSTIIDDLKLATHDRVALLVNNLGGTPASELAIVAGDAIRYLRARNVRIERAWSGTFLSALDMAGVSLTLLRVDEARLGWLDAATRTSAWPLVGGHPSEATRHAPVRDETAQTGPGLSVESTLRHVIEAICDDLIAAEATLTQMDHHVGDGDFGTSAARVARAVRSTIDTCPPESAPADVLRALSATVRRVMGGTSGPLYAVMLLRAASELGKTGRMPDARAWSHAFSAAVEGVMELGGARPGDRTMVDALDPAARALRGALDASDAAPSDGPARHAVVPGIAPQTSPETGLEAAIEAARRGAAETANMTPKRGRSSYVGERALGFVDPGAHAVGLWLDAIRRALARGRER